MKIDQIISSNVLTSFEKVLAVQAIIHDNFSEQPIHTLDPIQLDKHLFERVNLAIEELVEANRELKHRKPHRVTVEGKTVNANKALSDIKKFKSELVDATQIIFSILGALKVSEEEFITVWEEHVNEIKHLTAENKYETKSLFEEDDIGH